MSSVNPSDTYNGYYTKHLSDLEDELKTDYKRAQQRSREQTDELAHQYEDSTRKTNDRANETVEQIRNDMQEKYNRSRESDRTELELSKRQQYDRFGRDRTNEADALRQRLEEYSRSAEADRAGNDKQLRDVIVGADRKAEALTKQYEERLDRAVQSERESAQTAYEELVHKQKSALQEQGEENAKKYGELSHARLEDQQDNRRRTDTLISDNKLDMDNLARHLNDAIDQRLDKDHQAGVERQEEAARKLRQSHDNQSAELRAQLRDLLAGESQYVKERGQGRTDAVRDYEDEWRSRLNMAEEARKTEVNALKARADDTDTRNVQNADARMRERDAYFTHMMAQQAQENREEHNALVDRYGSALKEKEKQTAKDHQYADQRLENAMRSANEERETALLEQSASYQRSNATQRQHDLDSIEALQTQLNKRTAPSEEQDISPAVENAVRRSIVRQYEKNLNAETERNKLATDSLQQSYADKMQTLLDAHQSQLTERDQQHQTEKHQAEVRFVEHIQDTETAKDEALRFAQQDHDRETETLNRVYSQSTLRQKNDYDSIIQSLKDDAASRIQATRQEAEFAVKQQQRAFSVRENELIRDYEKKLADQKMDYEGRLDDLKTQTQQNIRETERRDKVNFDDQTRNYEQRIAQLEDQHKERERTITQNFQDELDKVRRSNALLQSKKG